MTSEIRLFTRESVAKAKEIVENPDEPADPERGGGFAEWVMLALHALRIEFGKSYRQTLDFLSEMPSILEELGLTRLPHFTALRNSFASISIQRWRAFLGRSAEKRTGHAAVDATGFDRDQPSRHYAQRAHYHVRSLKVTTRVDVETGVLVVIAFTLAGWPKKILAGWVVMGGIVAVAATYFVGWTQTIAGSVSTCSNTGKFITTDPDSG